MEKLDAWKQSGPGMQITAIVSSLKGWKSILDEGMISREEFNAIFEEHAEQLLYLGDMLYNNTWKDCKCLKK